MKRWKAGNSITGDESSLGSFDENQIRERVKSKQERNQMMIMRRKEEEDGYSRID